MGFRTMRGDRLVSEVAKIGYKTVSLDSNSLLSNGFNFGGSLKGSLKDGLKARQLLM